MSSNSPRSSGPLLLIGGLGAVALLAVVAVVVCAGGTAVAYGVFAAQAPIPEPLTFEESVRPDVLPPPIMESAAPADVMQEPSAPDASDADEGAVDVSPRPRRPHRTAPAPAPEPAAPRRVVPAEELDLDAGLAPAPTSGVNHAGEVQLRIETIPRGATASFDREDVGSTPVSAWVSPGEVKVKLRHPDMGRTSQTLTVGADGGTWCHDFRRATWRTGSCL